MAAGSLAFSNAAIAKDYQVTGPVVEVNDTTIVVEKTQGKNEKWELKKDSSTKGSDVKVGDEVTVHYTMTATKIEAKAAKAAKETKDTKKEASPATSPKK